MIPISFTNYLQYFESSEKKERKKIKEREKKRNDFVTNEKYFIKI